MSPKRSGESEQMVNQRRENAMFVDERRMHIVTELRAAGRIDAAKLAGELNVTNETIRKDLIALEMKGLLRRVHGGAVPVGGLSFEPPVTSRTDFPDEKARIGRAALRHLPPAGAILIDAGSTTARFAELLPDDRELTVYTNTLPLALALLDRPNLTVITLGGRVRPVTQAEVGDWTERALAEINVDVAFLGANAISVARGLTTPDPVEAGTKRLMLTCARRRILLADHSKVGQVSLRKHADLDELDLLITDKGISRGDLEKLEAAGLEVELA